MKTTRFTTGAAAIGVLSAAAIMTMSGCEEKKPVSPAPRPAQAPGDSGAGETAPPVADRVTRTGVLRSGMAGIGGEHTGWGLVQAEGENPLEVDVTKAQADADRLDGQRVRITGAIVKKKYVERGEVDILVAEMIESAPE